MKMREMKHHKILILLASTLILLGYPAIGQEKLLSLSDAIQTGLGNNYGVIISEYDTEIASLNNNWGTAGRYPSISFSAGSLNSIDIENSDNTTVNVLRGDLNMNWTIFDGFRVVITKDKLEQLENLSKGRSAVVIESTIEEIIMSYYAVLLESEKLKLFEQVMTLSEDRYLYEELRNETGNSLVTDLLQAKNVYLEDKAAWLRQSVAVNNAIRYLNFLLGTDPETEYVFTEDFQTDTASYNLDDLSTKMMEGNQSLKNQYINLLLQEKEIDLKKSDLTPSLNLSAGLENSYNRSLPPGGSVVNRSALSPYANLSLKYNIFSGGNRKRAIRIAELDLEVGETETQEIKHNLKNQLFSLFEQYQLRKELLYVSEESRETAGMNMKISGEKYKTGAITSFEYRAIQLIFLNASLNRLESVYRLIETRTALTRITGGFLQQQ